MLHYRNPSFKAVTAVLAVVLLLVATFAATLPHNHHGTSETACQICHFSHQPADQHLALNRIAVPVPLGRTPVVVALVRSGAPSLSIRISRAPPLA
jgi:hypothetical protein